MNTIRVAVAGSRYAIGWEDLMGRLEYWNFQGSTNAEIIEDLTTDEYRIHEGDIENWNRIGRRIFICPINHKVFDMVAI